VAGGAVTVRMRRTRNASAAIEDDMDIVIRLRKETSPLMHDAAREIERLRAELTRLLAKHEQTADVLAASNEQNGDWDGLPKRQNPIRLDRSGQSCLWLNSKDGQEGWAEEG
jgi:hypothetical protein